jgi:CO dehydrogenase/acetyl-CoA synthase delta subunit
VTVTTSDPAGSAAGLRAAFDLTAQVIDNIVRVERADGHRFVPQLVEKFPGWVETVQVGRPDAGGCFREAHRPPVLGGEKLDEIQRG